MNQNKSIMGDPHKKSVFLIFQPIKAWGPILGLALLSTLCLLVHAGSLLRIVFPLGSFIIAIILHREFPILYMGFCWWLWFLNPWISRLSDYQSGTFDETRLILISSYLPGIVIIPQFLQYLPGLHKRGGLPFAISLAGICFGSLIGFINTDSPATVVKATLDWTTPVLFGFYFFLNWRIYPNIQQNTQRVFTFGLLVMGLYGIFQFLVPSEADKFWLDAVIATGNTSFGLPMPFGIRLFSTMNSPGPYAVFSAAGVLLLTDSRGSLQLSASLLGYLNLLLSLVRSSWLGWIAGIFTLGSSLKRKAQIRLILITLVLGIVVVFLITIEPFSTVITSRLQTLTDVQNDTSAGVRKEIYAENLNLALSSFIGDGIGNAPNHDSAILDFLLSLGWLGTVLYTGGLIKLFLDLLQRSKNYLDPFIMVVRSIIVCTLFQMPFGSVMLAPSGIVLWGFLGIGVAGYRYSIFKLTEVQSDF